MMFNDETRWLLEHELMLRLLLSKDNRYVSLLHTLEGVKMITHEQYVKYISMFRDIKDMGRRAVMQCKVVFRCLHMLLHRQEAERLRRDLLVCFCRMAIGGRAHTDLEKKLKELLVDW